MIKVSNIESKTITKQKGATLVSETVLVIKAKLLYLVRDNVQFPILISETENFNLGDTFYDKITKRIQIVDEQEIVDYLNDSSNGKTRYKILAFKQQFTAKIVEQLIVKDVKENDTVLLECENDYVRCGGDLKMLGGDGESGEGQEFPFWMKCHKCKETSDYNEVTAQDGCDMIPDTSKRVMIVKVNSKNKINIIF